jgi:hypothetical protein
MSRLYLSNPCAFFLLSAHGAAGAVGVRLSLRPLSERGTTNLQNPGEIAPRECGCMFPRIARMKTMILLRRDLLLDLLRLDGAELEFGNLAERIERGLVSRFAAAA